jgi:[protein-PII] uridylyltransferase
MPATAATHGFGHAWQGGPVARRFEELVDLAKAPHGASASLPRDECLAATREFAASRRAVIRERHNSGESGSNVVRMLSETADEMLRGVFGFGLFPAPARHNLVSRVAICALGGYGRGELSPYSDLDICLLYEGALDKNLRDLNGFLVPFLWDIGFVVGYSIHSVEEACELARSDRQAFTSFLESRLVAGNSTVFARLKLAIRELQSGTRSHDFIRCKVHERYDGLAGEYRDLYGPEPNLKESAGGLRDFHTALWLLMMAYGTSNLDEAVGQGLLTPEEHLDFVEGLDFIWRLRNELHFHNGRGHDWLDFTNQRHLAQAFGYGSGEPSEIASLMQDYYSASGQNRRFLRIAARICHYPSSAALPDATVSEKSPWAIQNGQLYLTVQDVHWFAHNPSRLMEVFWRCARHKVHLSRPMERLVAENLGLVGEPFRTSDLVRRFFVAICTQPLRAGYALRHMAAAGLLARYLPEFGAVAGIIRYQNFHTYPVDEHTLRAIEALARIPDMEGPIGRGLCEAQENLTDPHVLVLALLFHDLGKVSGDIHVEESTRIANEVCQRMGLSDGEQERIEFLVRHHGLMTTISQYRDVDDDEIVQSFAGTVRTELRLRGLFLLSYADLSAVGPTVWNDWKGALLLRLYLRAMRRIAGRAETVGEAHWESPKAKAIIDLTREDLRDRAEDHLKGLEQRYIVAFSAAHIAKHLECVAEAQETGLSVECLDADEAGMSEVVVCTRDRHGLFAAIAGSFASQLLDVTSAALFTRPDGIVVDVFAVTDARQHRPLTEAQQGALRRTLEAVLVAGEDVQVYLDRARRRLFALLQPRVAVPTVVKFDNGSSRDHTVIDVETGDRTGLLYDIARAMADAGLDIATARIVTDARRVRDSFYVIMDGGKIEDETTQAAIREAIHDAIHPRTASDVKGGQL